MHVGLAKPRWRGKRSWHSRRMQSVILRIWQETHACWYSGSCLRQAIGGSPLQNAKCGKRFHVTTSLCLAVREDVLRLIGDEVWPALYFYPCAICCVILNRIVIFLVCSPSLISALLQAQLNFPSYKSCFDLLQSSLLMKRFSLTLSIIHDSRRTKTHFK